MCKENIDPKDLENLVNPCSEENNTEDNSGNGGENNNSNAGNTGQTGSSSGDGKPVRPQPNWGVGGLSIDNPEDNK